MEKYEPLEMEVIEFETEDILTTSFEGNTGYVIIPDSIPGSGSGF